jgi:molecular chaperone DnaJ
VPPGIGDGQRLRLTGQGGTGEGAPDLILTVHVRRHSVFERKGIDLVRELPISLSEALLGGTVHVGTIAGKTLALTIPPGTQTGRTFRLAGHGLPRFRAEGRGDLLVRVRVVLPAQLSDAAREAARRFLELAGQPDPRA